MSAILAEGSGNLLSSTPVPEAARITSASSATFSFNRLLILAGVVAIVVQPPTGILSRMPVNFQQGAGLFAHCAVSAA